MQNEPIQDYILASQNNLKIAAAVSDAWPNARNRLINDFLNRLGVKLRKDLPGWKVEQWKQFFEDPYPNFCLWKRAWEDKYYIILQCNEKGKRMVFGVMRDEDNPRIKSRSFDPKLFAAIQNIHPGAQSRAWFEAAIPMSPEPDWSKPEILWQIHNDKAFLNNVAEQLLEVAKISEHHLDRLAKKR